MSFNGELDIPYVGQDPYIFVSYSHTEREKVENVLGLLFRNGVRVWYDVGLLAGENWEDTLEQKIRESGMFLCFLANGIEQRKVVLNEIRLAMEMNKADSTYRVVFVFLEKMPSSAFEDENIRAFIDKKQHILYHGITDALINQLLNTKVISSEFVDAEYREQQHMPNWEFLTSNNITDHVFDDGLLNNSYVYPQEFPEKKVGEYFYRTSPEQIHPDAAFPLCLDNQWCPTDFYAEATFWENGFSDIVLAKRIQKIQKTEVFRALLHNKQIVLNRAAIFNSQIFDDWYKEDTSDYAAFTHLLEDGSILIYLMKEKRPQQPPRFQTTQAESWGALCKNNQMYCLKFDWNNDENNNNLIEKNLGNVFQQFCLSLPENKKILNELSLLFDFTPEQQNSFEETCVRVQHQVANRDRDLDETKKFSREIFYKKFLVKRGSSVPQCILDIRKPFAPELKELIDFKYSVNLPSALGVRILYPEVGLFKRLGQIFSENYSGRKIGWDELTCAIGQFQPDFISGKIWSLKVDVELELQNVCDLRDLSSWQNYMRSASAGRKRARLNEVDFFDIRYVWNAYVQWLEQARQQIDDLQWEQTSACISIVFQIGSTKITAVYEGGKAYNRYKVEKESTFLKNNQGNHSVPIYIDYFCADVLLEDYRSNSLIAAIPLFEGVSVETENAVVERIVAQYDKSGFTRIPEDPIKIKFKKHFKEKENSEEWRSYVELMQTRPYEFVRSSIYDIETDLRTICEYEIMNNKKIGVRYQSPFSIVLLDLVKDSQQNLLSYERILPAVPFGAVVCIPVYKGQFVLLKQFRHALRSFQYCFPRGFAEAGISSRQNAEKELYEELGCKVAKIEELGEVVADSGLNGNKVSAFFCKISEPRLNMEHEGIVDLKMVSSEELGKMIMNGQINDGFTLAAYSLLMNSLSMK